MQKGLSSPIFFILGATGSGKSAAAIALASTLKEQYNYDDVVIINCDVMQFYRNLPIATNMSTPEEMSGIPHLFMGFLSPDDSFISHPEQPFISAGTSSPSSTACSVPFNIQNYTERVLLFLDGYFTNNQNAAAIICGGTCYYLQAILFNNTIINGDDSSPTETENNDFKDDANIEELWPKLNAIDPVIASQYHPNDRRRIKRMLEIHKISGAIPSDLYNSRVPTLRFLPQNSFMLWTSVEKKENHVASLDKRVDVMVEKGLVEEVEAFQNTIRGKTIRTSITEAIGFKEFGELTGALTNAEREEVIQDALSKVKSNTRRYAKQQERWITNRILPMLSKSGFLTRHCVKIQFNNSTQISDLVSHATEVMLSESEPREHLTLPLSKSLDERSAISQEHCSLCDMIVIGRDQMEIHRGSKRHRGAVKRKALEARHREAFGCDLPPPKRSKQK